MCCSCNFQYPFLQTPDTLNPPRLTTRSKQIKLVLWQLNPNKNQLQAHLPGCMHYPINTRDNQKQGCWRKPNRSTNAKQGQHVSKWQIGVMHDVCASRQPGDILHTAEASHVAIKTECLLRSRENPADFRAMSTALLIRIILLIWHKKTGHNMTFIRLPKWSQVFVSLDRGHWV